MAEAVVALRLLLLLLLQHLGATAASWTVT
jgi:hypothetical protein